MYCLAERGTLIVGFVSNSLQLATVVLTLLFQWPPQRPDCCAVVVSGPLHGFFLCLSAGAIQYGLTDAACVMRLEWAIKRSSERDCC